MSSIARKPGKLRLRNGCFFLGLIAVSVGWAFAQEVQVGSRKFANRAELVRQGSRCGTPDVNDAQRERIRGHLAQLRQRNARFRADAGQINVPVYFHVLMDDDGSGDVSDEVLETQVVVLNEAFNRHGVRFSNAGVDRTKNSIWYHMRHQSAAEREAKTKLRKTPERALNFYTSDGGGLLGWATFPYELAGDPDVDGVVVLNLSLKDAGGPPPYNLGDTGVHEVGHWLGLYHTFQDGCEPPGDEVDDTPSEAAPAFGNCEENMGRDTCPASGVDPIENFMDYTDDDCMDRFSDGQILRVFEQVGVYRPDLLTNEQRVKAHWAPVDTSK